ncbi:D-alanine--D-serine ligase VanG [Clostridium sp. 'deep sea']|uniref:D-alanine--D-serine ligase VanG n=1 Tax=Clostridium sp. 'deep sea' TaxID=2779445 RepID=UPI00189660F6|nr:D-alanine--D-serine ligase VanG [Clostridium sp. 'deep sea']QOR36131.1 D-alanine--D-serine ligase VanG [Clostridium sp. 'deep sea']
MKKKRIAVIFGGHSSEYSVSLQSASAVIQNINQEKYETLLIGITKYGNWYKYNGNIANILNDSWYNPIDCVPALISPNRGSSEIIELNSKAVIRHKVDVVFPILHGKFGEDGTLQGLLELSGIPYVGCDTLSSALCMDKDLAHIIAKVAGVKIPNYIVINKNTSIVEVIHKIKSLEYPLIVKPAKAGSSFGITKVDNEKELSLAIKTASIHDKKIVIEEFIKGFEVGCAIFGNDKLTIGEVDEIELSKGFFNYTEKYSLQTSKIHLPARLNKNITNKVKNTALKLYKALQCKGFARVDMFVTPTGEIVFNEINTIPGFTTHSRFPNMLKGIGLGFTEIIDNLIDLALQQ